MQPVLYGAIVALIAAGLSYAAAIKGIRRAREADRNAIKIAVRTENREDLEGVIDALDKLVEKLQAQLQRSEANTAEAQIDARELRVERGQLRGLLAECTAQCRAAQAELRRLTEIPDD